MNRTFNHPFRPSRRFAFRSGEVALWPVRLVSARVGLSHQNRCRTAPVGGHCIQPCTIPNSDNLCPKRMSMNLKPARILQDWHATCIL